MNTPSSAASPERQSADQTDTLDGPRGDTGGIQVNAAQQWLVTLVELLSSMRFAISLLCLISVAAAIGTTLTQNEPMTNYVNQFGPFWYEIFAKLRLYTVYSAWWFLLITFTLVVSTSLCLVRNAPKMLKDMRAWRENVREQSLRNFHHKHEWASQMPITELASRMQQALVATGYQVKLVVKGNDSLLLGKRGAGNKFGYIFAHSAIVVIVIGAVLDSDLPIRIQMLTQDKEVFVGGGMISQIPEKHRLSVSNPTFRGNTMIPEGSNSNAVIIQQTKGVLIQDLPFTIELKKFHIDFYSTGMPKLFASDVVLREPGNPKPLAATIKVNEPLLHKGYAIYQSSFEDGGSKLKLSGHAMVGDKAHRFEIAGEVGGSSALGAESGTEYTIEWTGFRPFNVENMGSDTRAVDPNKSFNEKFLLGLEKNTGSAAKNANNKALKNVGPNVQYKVRDKTGQAREYQNYMQPVMMDGVQVYLSGMRESPNDPFSYLRIPADDEGGIKDWMRIRAALQNPQMRAAAAQRYGMRAMPTGSLQRDDAEKLAQQLQDSALKSMAMFAGDGKRGGFLAISDFMQRLPQQEQQKAVEIFMKIFNGAMWDLWQLAREKDGLSAVAADEKHGRFLEMSVNAISDSFFYGAPVYLQLEDFEQIKASVLQVTRAPGQNIVYLGCLLLVLGVFAMLYVRERRLWIWLKPGEQGVQALLALSTQRKTLDFEREFEQLKAHMQHLS